MKILIIDDTKSVHAFVKNLLGKSAGLETLSVFNGAEAMGLLAERKSEFDLILLDWEMPVMDGPTTLSAIKASGITAPVMMMTTKNEMKDIENMLALGAAEYLMKPFTIDILFDKIEYVTGRRMDYAS